MIGFYGVLLLVLVSLMGLVGLMLRRTRTEPTEPWEPRRNQHPWNQRSDPAIRDLAPPAEGFSSTSLPSEEFGLESIEYHLDDEEPTGPVPKISVSATGQSDRGMRRGHNEDVVVVLKRHDLFAVADGMGGYAAGEVAAKIVADTLEEAFDAETFGGLDDGMPRRGAELVAALTEANRRVRKEAAAELSKRGMGTTVVSARFSAGRQRAYIAHVGDSRCYRLRGNEFVQLTEDHTLGALGITGPSAGKLSRAVGVFDELDVELQVDKPQVGDLYLLCSDGLYKMLSDDAIRDLMLEHRNLKKAVSMLVAKANERGGRDNVSVVLMRVDPPNTPSDPPVLTLET